MMGDARILDTATAIGEYAAKRTPDELRVLVEIERDLWDEYLYLAESAAWKVIHLYPSGDKIRSNKWNNIWRTAKVSLPSLPLPPSMSSRVWNATLNAMLATYTRDHVGQHGYTQAHYDLLMEPWIEWVGEMDK